VGQGGFEPPTPRLSSVCSNQLSYRPSILGPAAPDFILYPAAPDFELSFKEPCRFSQNWIVRARVTTMPTRRRRVKQY
jgi:hypothetical protein